MKTSPTQRTLKYLRDKGYSAAVVGRWNPYAKIRQDLFGWIDIVAVVDHGPGVLGVQTTTRGNMHARLRKARGNKHLLNWLRSDGRLQVHGWMKRKGHWEVVVVNLREEDVM